MEDTFIILYSSSTYPYVWSRYFLTCQKYENWWVMHAIQTQDFYTFFQYVSRCILCSVPIKNFLDIQPEKYLAFHEWQWEASKSSSLSSLYSPSAMWMCVSIFTDCLCKRRTFVNLNSIFKVRLYCSILTDICIWNWWQGIYNHLLFLIYSKTPSGNACFLFF